MQIDHCEFCAVFEKREKIIFEDEATFAIEDRDAKSAQAHLLLCPKEHLESASALEPRHIPLLRRLEANAIRVMNELQAAGRAPAGPLRLGYHLPPLTTVHHLHLHCFLLPFRSPVKDQVYYGHCLHPTNSIIKSIVTPRL